MRERLYRWFLRAWRHVPRGVRRRLVRALSPSFTVGSICVIERPDGAILLVKHIYRSDWGIPGGLLKRGEEPADAARREVAEEVGLAIELVGEPAVVVESRLQRVDLVFRARPRELAELESVRPRSAEIEQVRWFAPGELPRLQPETATALVALARAAASGRVAPAPLLED
ncbi:NUDIX hydrolase [Rhabdothermincola sp.]|uniref:NUDIX hydrolase n=1 Tax=Rhabdothermincola sp. TaxID=2820405 RepID=UPI002FE3A0C3